MATPLETGNRKKTKGETFTFMYNLRSTTVSLESGAQSTGELAAMQDEKQVLNTAESASQGNYAVIFGDCGDDANDPPSRVQVIAINGKVIYSNLTTEPCPMPPTEE